MTTHAVPNHSPGADPGRRSVGKVVLASLIGTATEWYDFFLFGSAAALVFGEVFFGQIGGTEGTLYAFMTYALGFVARPIGGVVFGHFGDRVGRKKMLVASLLMMGLGTFAIGLLPTYASIGLAAPVLLVFCRLLQGFAVGGEWGGAVLMVSEHGSDGWRGFWASWPQAGVAMGNLLATGVLWILAAVQSDAAFLDWGWRIPFLLSAVLVAVGMWVRLTIEESPVFKEAAEQMEKQDRGLPILEVIKEYPREVFVAMGMRLAENISYYIFTVISITYATTYIAVDKPVILRALLIGAAIQFADRAGLRCAVRQGRTSPALPRRCGRRGRVDVRLLRPARHQGALEDPARRRGRPDPALADVRPAGGVLLRAVRHLGALHRRLGRLPARLDLRRCPGADHRAEAAR